MDWGCVIVSKTPFPKGHVLNDIWASLNLVAQELNVKHPNVTFAIPERTAKMISDRREIQASLRIQNDDSLAHHVGWGLQTNVVDSICIVSLWNELAEIYGIPAGFFSALEYSIRDDPAFMDVRVVGLSPFLIDSYGSPTIDLEKATHSTPALMRLAWDGALSGDYWDVESIMHLPKTVYHNDDKALEAAERVGVEVEFA
jgi:hypothetical protein